MAEQAGLSLTWSETPKTGFLMTGLACIFFRFYYHLVDFYRYFKSVCIVTIKRKFFTESVLLSG